MPTLSSNNSGHTDGERLLKRLRHRLHPLRRAWRQWKWDLRQHRDRARTVGWPAHLRPWLTRRVRVEQHGAAFRLALRGAIATEVWVTGSFEAHGLAFVLRCLSPGAVFFDVGANTGYYAVAAARLFPSLDVYAFEPCRETCAVLRGNLRLNGLANVRAVHSALGDRSGEAVLHVNAAGKDGLNTLGTPVHPSSREVGRETVPLTTLDEFVSSLGIGRVDVMKVDVEGAELLVFRGGRALLSRPDAPLLLFEYAEWTSGFGYRPEDTLRFLDGLGYEFFLLDDDTGALSPLPPEAFRATAPTVPASVTSVVGVKPGHPLRARLGTATT